MGNSKNIELAYQELQEIGVPVMKNDWGGVFQISAESNDDIIWADAYSSGGDLDEFGIHHKINRILDKYSLSSEWYNTAVLCVY